MQDFGITDYAAHAQAATGGFSDYWNASTAASSSFFNQAQYYGGAAMHGTASLFDQAGRLKSAAMHNIGGGYGYDPKYGMTYSPTFGGSLVGSFLPILSAPRGADLSQVAQISRAALGDRIMTTGAVTIGAAALGMGTWGLGSAIYGAGGSIGSGIATGVFGASSGGLVSKAAGFVGGSMLYGATLGYGIDQVTSEAGRYMDIFSMSRKLGKDRGDSFDLAWKILKPGGAAEFGPGFMKSFSRDQVVDIMQFGMENGLISRGGSNDSIVGQLKELLKEVKVQTSVLKTDVAGALVSMKGMQMMGFEGSSERLAAGTMASAAGMMGKYSVTGDYMLQNIRQGVEFGRANYGFDPRASFGSISRFSGYAKHLVENRDRSARMFGYDENALTNAFVGGAAGIANTQVSRVADWYSMQTGKGLVESFKDIYSGKAMPAANDIADIMRYRVGRTDRVAGNLYQQIDLAWAQTEALFSETGMADTQENRELFYLNQAQSGRLGLNLEQAQASLPFLPGKEGRRIMEKSISLSGKMTSFQKLANKYKENASFLLRPGEIVNWFPKITPLDSETQTLIKRNTKVNEFLDKNFVDIITKGKNLSQYKNILGKGTRFKLGDKDVTFAEYVGKKMASEDFSGDIDELLSDAYRNTSDPTLQQKTIRTAARTLGYDLMIPNNQSVEWWNDETEFKDWAKLTLLASRVGQTIEIPNYKNARYLSDLSAAIINDSKLDNEFEMKNRLNSIRDSHDIQSRMLTIWEQIAKDGIKTISK